MARDLKQLIVVVVGHGAAGLAAALSAAEAARAAERSIAIKVLERAPRDKAGGNTRWSPANIRMDTSDSIAPQFEADMQEACGGQGDLAYFHVLAERAPETIGWLQRHGITFASPPYYLSTGPRRIQPVGGGSAIVASLRTAAEAAAVTIRYETEADRILTDPDGRICGVALRAKDGATALKADAVVLATGGFQGNAAMMAHQFGAEGATVRMIAPGTGFNRGDGIRMAGDLGAKRAGDWNGMHIEPVDPRSDKPAPVVLVYPYGIVVDRNGRRFCDEGAGLVHETWEALSRDIHFNRPGSIAYAVLDSRLFEIEGFERAIRSDVPPYRAETVEELAGQIGLPPVQLRQTTDEFNAAATGDISRFDVTRRDGLATTAGFSPQKSNWARPLTRAPYLAFPLVGAIAYTFGGIATDERARVLADAGPIPGLYAAGETTGHFHRTAPNAVAMLRALVFGRIAGQEAVNFLMERHAT
jgi:tricarballylate dehydrogenase